jgi:hypothetical protein
MDAAAARVRALVSRLPVGTPEPKPEVATRPAVASQPELLNTSSAIDFDPREHPSTWGPKNRRPFYPACMTGERRNGRHADSHRGRE